MTAGILNGLHQLYLLSCQKHPSPICCLSLPSRFGVQSQLYSPHWGLFLLIPCHFVQRPSTFSMSNPWGERERAWPCLLQTERGEDRGNCAAFCQNKNRLIFQSHQHQERAKIGSEVRQMRPMWTDGVRERARAVASFPRPYAQWMLKHGFEIKLCTLGSFCQRGFWDRSICICVCMCMYGCVCMGVRGSVFHMPLS